MAEEKNETTPPGGRSKEDIALDLMKFIAQTTNYGKGGTNTGFSTQGTRTAEEHAAALLELYTKCRKTIG